MTSNKIANNTIINLLYQIVSILIALIFIPISISALGVDLFGVYSLSITFLVLFNYLNFGIAPSTTKELSIKINKKEYSNINSIIFNSFIIMLIIGIIFLLFFTVASEYLASMFFQDKPTLQNQLKEFLFSIGLLSPLVFLILTQRAILESIQLFKITSFIKMLLNSIIFISPVIIYFNYFNIHDIFNVIILTYIVSIIYQFIFIFKMFLLKYPLKFYIADQKKLLRVGIFIMVSGLLMAVLSYFDRYYIAYFLSASDVSYYTISFDTISRLNIIIWSIISVLFPALSAWYANNEMDKIRKYLSIGLKLSFFIFIFISSFFILFAHEILEIWIDSDFADNSALIFQLLSIGIIFNAISVIPSRALIAFGREKALVYLLLVEFLFYIFILLILLNIYGLVGVAISYIIKSVLQFILLMNYINKRDLHFVLTFKNQTIRKFTLLGTILNIVVFTILQYVNFEYKLIFFLIYSIFYIYVWNKYIIHKELLLLTNLIKKKRCINEKLFFIRLAWNNKYW